MKVDLYDFHLPEQLIAQTPLEQRASSRLMVLDQKTGELTHSTFTQIKDYLELGDCLVLNDTKVLPARLHGSKVDTNASIEILLLRNTSGDCWEALVKPAKRVQVGTEVTFGKGVLKATCLEVLDQGGRILQFQYDGVFMEILDQLGEMPLPPYIKEQLHEKDRYQTVYAREEGSAAAPTAGLHFTKDLLAELVTAGIKIATITLHVGLGTFRPVSAETVEEHQMHSEYYTMSAETAQMLNQVRASGKRIISVGTTSTRTLETIARDYEGQFSEANGWTDIFIYPGYEFKAIDGMITNFHLPKSTLIMLVSALAGRENVLHAYQTAVAESYRFFSFGDAMLIK